MKKFGLVFLAFLFTLQLSLPVFAEEEVAVSPASGTWKMDAVYEGGELLDPEGAASLYAENVNTYVLSPNGDASVLIPVDGGMDISEMTGRWSLQENDCHFSVEGYEMNLVFDAEENVLHRYWNIDDPDASYHDLDFVYVKIPAGDWQMVRVLSHETGAEPVLLDPENSASLYAEGRNICTIASDGTFTVLLPEGAEEKGTWKLENGDLLMSYESGYEMPLKYDPKTETLSRTWKDETPEASYHDLEFVYEKK